MITTGAHFLLLQVNTLPDYSRVNLRLRCRFLDHLYCFSKATEHNLIILYSPTPVRYALLL